MSVYDIENDLGENFGCYSSDYMAINLAQGLDKHKRQTMDKMMDKLLRG